MPETAHAGQPTPSERTNRLLHLLAEAKAGRSLAEASTEVQARQAELAAALAEFHAGVAAAPDAPREAAGRVVAGFERYRAALEAAGRALEGSDPGDLDPAAASLAGAAGELHEAMRAYEWAWLTAGATPYPLLNLLYRLRALLDDAAAEAARAGAWTGAVLKQAAGDLARDPRLADLAAAFDHAGAWAAEADLSDPAQRAQASSEIQRVCAAVEGALLQEWAPPAPPSSWLEATLVAGRMASRGELPPELFLEALEALEARMVFAYTKFEGSASLGAAATPLIQDEIVRARDRFAMLNEAIDRARSALEGQGPLDEAVDALQKAAEGLFESILALEEADRRQGLVACPRCGHDNPAGARVCSACAGQLPRVAAPEAADLPASGHVRSENLLELLTACEKVLSGQISPEQFAGYVRWGFDLAARGREGLAALPTEDDEAVRAAARALAEGIDEFEQGLEDLQAWLSGGGVDFYHSGTRRLLRGGQKLEALRDEAVGPLD